MNTKPIFILMLLALLIAGCSPIALTNNPNPQPATPAQEAQNPAADELQGALLKLQPEAAMPAVPAPGEYPSSPEGVVQAFLASYEAEPQQMAAYLSAGQAANAPAEGAAGLLDFNGAIEGFVIDAAAVSPEPPAAIVSAAVKVGGSETRRTFTLGKENGRWKIEAVETPAG